VAATVKYEASGGYVTYTYKKSGSNLNIIFTGNAAETNRELLMPKGKKSALVKLNDAAVNYHTKKIEQSEYIAFTVNRLGVNKIGINF
jgi:hypothetical protein